MAFNLNPLRMAHTPDVRVASHAGTWYPGTAEALRQTIETSLAQVQPLTLPGRVLALVSPHPGYRFGSRIAANAYAQVRNKPFRRVVLLGPLHRPIWGIRLGPFMVPAERSYQTPMGDVPVDRDFVERLAQRLPLTNVRRDKEHALELQVPFLQVTLETFTLVPIMLGEHVGDPGALERLEALSTSLAELAGDDTLFVSTTDLSHLHNDADVRRIDQRTAAFVNAFDIDGLARAFALEDVYACGATALVAVLKAAQKRGATGARVLAYATSGDVSGDKRPGTYTVGYMAAAAYAT
jgi:AmmeMemoRadiSam system protein B